MPMIDVYATEGTFKNKKELLKALCARLMQWEKVPPISLFLDNTAAFLHELKADEISTARGDNNYVRVQILTPAGTLRREQQLGVVKDLTQIIADAAGDPTQVERTWVLIHESPDGAWGIDGHAYTNAEIPEAARKEMAAAKK